MLSNSERVCTFGSLLSAARVCRSYISNTKEAADDGNNNRNSSLMWRIVIFGPRFQVDVWQLSARHSLVVTVAIDCRLDFSHVHRSILVPASTPSSALQLSSEGAAEVPKMSVFYYFCTLYQRYKLETEYAPATRLICIA